MQVLDFTHRVTCCVVGSFILPALAGVTAPSAGVEYPELRGAIVENISNRFKNMALSAEPDAFNFDAADKFKAGAACLIWQSDPTHPAHIQSWGIGSRHGSQQEANLAALKRCNVEADQRAHSSDCKCQLILEGGSAILEPPVEAILRVKASLKVVSNIPTICSNWVSDGEIRLPINVDEDASELCEGYTAESALRYDFPIERIEPIADSDSPEIYPGPPPISIRDLRVQGLFDSPDRLRVSTDITFSPPTLEPGLITPFSLPGDWTYEYDLHRLPGNQSQVFLNRLNKLDGGKLFGKFWVRSFAPSPEEWIYSVAFARYVRSYNLSSSPEFFDETYFHGFPDETTALLDGERSSRLWFIATVPVDSNWIPTGRPLRKVVPIALETTKSLYIFGERIVSLFRWRDSAGGNILTEPKPSVDLSACASSASCKKRVLNEFTNQVVRVFEESPLDAKIVRSALRPHQILLQRLYEESNVLALLDGLQGPWYEISTYSISVWIADKFGGELDVDDVPSFGPESIFVQVDLALQLGIGKKGGYPEPSADQYEAYRRAIEVAVRRAVEATAKKFSGEVSPEGVAVIGKVKESVRDED